MEHNTHEHKKNQQTLYIIIGGLILALIIQYFLFINKVNALKKEIRPTVTRETSLPSRNNYAASNPHYQRNYAAPAYGNRAQQWQAMFAEDPMMAFDRMQERLFRMFNTARAFAPMMAQQFGPDLSSDFMPAVDIEETDKAYMVRSDIPGLEKDKINITTRNGLLTIQGVREQSSENKDDQSGYYSVERSYGSFARTIPLPGPVDESRIKADYKNGVLTIELPKAGEGQNAVKKIAVQ